MNTEFEEKSSPEIGSLRNTPENILKIFCSGSCRLLTTFANRNNVDVIHTLFGPYFDGTNFMGKFHDTKSHIQFIKFIRGYINFNNEIKKRILTCYNYEKWNRHGILEALHTVPEKLQNLRNQINNCDVYIFEICSLKLYYYHGVYCQYEQKYDKNIDDYDIIIQNESDLYNDLLEIKNLFPCKKIIFQCHFRPNIIYNDISKGIEKREIIYNTLLKFCSENDNCFLYDPSIILKNNNKLFDGDNHFYSTGYDASFEYVYNKYLCNKKNDSYFI